LTTGLTEFLNYMMSVVRMVLAIDHQLTDPRVCWLLCVVQQLLLFVAPAQQVQQQNRAQVPSSVSLRGRRVFGLKSAGCLCSV
jgi:hypothetical protein